MASQRTEIIAPAATRWLEAALLLTIIAHTAAMASMAALLLPGMPGGGASLAQRASYLSTSPWLWRLGWLPWHLTALSDLLLAVAFLRTVWLPHRAAIMVGLVTLAAVLIEQPGELRWSFKGVTMAQAALQQGNLASYRQFESVAYVQVAGVAALLYTVTAILWSWCFAQAGTWHKALTGLSVVTWGLLMAVSVAPMLPPVLRLPDQLVAAGNALGFILMLGWFASVTELVLRRARPTSQYGRWAPWQHPRRSLVGVAFSFLANSRLIRAYTELGPMFPFDSDIRDVIYANYLVEASRLEPMVPEGLTLQRLGDQGQYALFTHLTYQHGHFGPRFLGRWRRLMPSPVQSNWRIYVADPRSGKSGIFFVYTTLGHLIVGLLARFFAEGIPNHLPRRSQVTAKPDGQFVVCLDPGVGSAPDLSIQATRAESAILPPSWQTCFDSYHDMLAYCVPQDRALSSQPWYRHITRQEIELNIPLDSCEPLNATVQSEAVRRLLGNSEPICFRVPNVTFQFHRQEHDETDMLLDSALNFRTTQHQV